ncbi:MAG: SsrA-binding protein SmpB [Verrucomicrobiales bacterium]
MDAEIAKNKKALHDFKVIEKFEAGIELKGTEVKSIREGKINLRDSFARVENGQVFLYGCDIQSYANASYEQHLPKRPRRLLLNKKEINQLFAQTQIKGLTIVALRAYWRNRHVKIEIGVCRGKDHADRREALKSKVVDREAQREMARFNKRNSLD